MGPGLDVSGAAARPRIRVATAGWSYPDWEGRVYPRSKPHGFHPLRHLAPSLDAIEINSTFYGMPRPQHAARWADLVAEVEGFRFVAKLHQDFTHGPEPEDLGVWAESMGRWREGIAPLVRRKLLGGVLVQFPVSFSEGPRAVRRLGRIRTLLEGLPAVLEVRHASWFEPRALAEVTGLGFSLAHVDLPPAWNHPPERHRPTGPIGYLRLHGRNAAMWFRSGAGRDDRYDYLYSPPEIGALARRAQSIAAETDETYVVTNNHFEGQAVANAIELRWLFNGRRPVPSHSEIVAAFPHLEPLVEPVPGDRGLFDA